MNVRLTSLSQVKARLEIPFINCTKPSKQFYYLSVALLIVNWDSNWLVINMKTSCGCQWQPYYSFLYDHNNRDLP